MEDRTQCRVNEVLTRTKQHRRQRECHLLGGLSVLCLLLTVGLAGAFGAVTSGLASGGGIPAVDQFATVLLHEGAGGYVLVGLLAFAAGALITILCLWWRKKH